MYCGLQRPRIETLPLAKSEPPNFRGILGTPMAAYLCISPSASLYSAPKTIASNHLTFDFTKRPFLTGRFWREAANRESLYVRKC